MTNKSLGIAKSSWRLILAAMIALVLVSSALVPLTDTALAQPVNPLRSFSPDAQVLPGETFDVTVTFTAPADDFNSVGIADTVPAGWAIQVDANWCTPVADAASITGDDAEYALFGPYSSGEPFTAIYRVTVPGGATPGLYPFSGQLGYKILSGDTIFEDIGGAFEVEVIDDGPSSISVTKTANPTSVTEPGGPVTFTVLIDNTSAVDSVTIDSLTDSVHGDLNGQGDCSVPQTIPAGGSYTCSFTATVSGSAGYVETDVATASGIDDDGDPVSNSDDATVTITVEPTPVPPAASIPTTSQWGLIGMATVFAALLILFVRRRWVANAGKS